MVAVHIETIAPTFTPATAATYRPSWGLAAARLGDRRLVDVTVGDLISGDAGCDQHGGGRDVGRVVEDVVEVAGDAVRFLEADHHGQAADEREVVVGQVDEFRTA